MAQFSQPQLSLAGQELLRVKEQSSHQAPLVYNPVTSYSWIQYLDNSY